MTIRQPVRAGMFYEAAPSACRAAAQAMFADVQLPEDLPAQLYGGLVPHAGWAFSGTLACETFQALFTRPMPPETIVLLGADHTGSAQVGEVWPDGAWQTPLGAVTVDEDLAAALIDGELLRANLDAHVMEHSIEVQIPLLESVCPEAKVVPIAVPADPVAVRIGQVIGRVLSEPSFVGRAAVVASTDLTHHGGHFGHVGGYGADSEAYTRTNDRRMLELVERMDADAIVPEALRYQNACGPGAVAAAIAAVCKLGAIRGRLLSYTNSYEVLQKQMPSPGDDTTVGYASVVFE